MPGELNELAALRADLAGAEAERRAHRVRLERARNALVRLEREGQPRTARRPVEREVRTLASDIGAITSRETELSDRIEALRERLRLRRPEDSVEQLDGQVPVALFPVRIETRFLDGGDELRVRIYPEQIHIDAHEPGLTEDELRLATAYWEARWAATNTDEHAAAWRQLIRKIRAARARWLVAATEPTNLDEIGTGTPAIPDVDLRSGPFTRQPTARLLPEQFVALGFRDGAEVMRAWGGPVTEGIPVGLPPDLDDDGSTIEVPDDQDRLAIDDSIRWLVDYDAARTAGMAITVTDRHLSAGRIRDGFDELLVVGVDWGADAEAASASIDEQLRRHAFTDGLAVLGTGVATNNTDESRSAPGTDPQLDGAAFDPATVDAAPATVSRLASALGVDPAVGLLGAPARGTFDDGAAADMHNALWASTMGAFLDQMMAPLVPTRVADDVHDHFTRYVRGQGPYPALRIGRQPYGVLPVAAGSVNTGDFFVDALARQLAGFRPFWAQAEDAVPRLGDSDQPDLDALELLRRTPRSATFRFREAFEGSVRSSILGFDLAAVFQEMVANLTLSLAGVQGRPRISGVTLDPDQRDVPVPLVAFGELSEVDPLDPNYISQVLGATSTTGGFKRLLSQPDQARTLLEALLRQSAGAEYLIGTILLVIDHELETRVLAEEPVFARIPEREVLGIAADTVVGPAPDAPASMLTQVESAVDIAEASITAIAGNRSLANHLAASSNTDLRRRVVTRRFAEFRASLDRLSKLSTAELDRVASSTLDCVSHRLDAWVTSVATRQLDAFRADDDRRTYIGAFGYVEDLRRSTDPVSRGYLHAPSVQHATTAAILRSGHLARGERPEGTLAVDLSSPRVSLALELVDGVRRGQPIGALLGYRFERSVRDTSLHLAKYILPIRQRTPIAEVSTGPDPTAPVEAIAARDVVDGIDLLDAWKADRGAYWSSLSIPVPNADRSTLDGLIERLDDALDAVSDLLVAESVHQAVIGNAERSAAALDALDRQQPLPDLGVIRTPRNATGLAHRLLVLFTEDGPAPGWTTNDPRQAADPRVDAWCGAVLGDPSRFRFAAAVRDDDGGEVERLEARLTDLGLSAIGTVCACATAGTEATELEQRLALHFGGLVTDPAAAEVELLDDPPAGSGLTALGLRDLVELAGEISDLLAGGRQADTRALLPDTERPTAGVDVAELRARADAAVATLETAVNVLEGLDDDSDVADVVTALLAAADAGAAGAVPGAEPPHVHADRVGGTARRTLDAVVAAEAAFDRAASDAAGIAAHDLDRLRSIYGTSFPAVARFTLPVPAADAEDHRASLTASATDPALLGDDLPAASWLGLHAPVRPAVARLTTVLEGAEMLGGRLGQADLHVAQLPHRPGAAWIGRPFDDPPPPTTSWVIHAASRPDFDGPLAGMVVDQWSEAVPATSETTGISFHFDAPGARAPQAVLLATPVDRTAASWKVDTLAATVREAMALARIRPLDVDDVDAVARFLPAAYLPFNLEAKLPSINLPAIIAAAVETHNLAFERSDA